MALVPGEGAVREFSAASPDPAFGDRVHAARPDVAQHSPDAGVGQHRVERVGPGAQELGPYRPGPLQGGVDVAGLEDLPGGGRCGFYSQSGELAVDRPVPPSGISRASRRPWRVAGRPALPRMDVAAQRLRARSRCQRRIVSGVTSSRSPWRRALGITLSRPVDDQPGAAPEPGSGQRPVPAICRALAGRSAAHPAAGGQDRW